MFQTSAAGNNIIQTVRFHGKGAGHIVYHCRPELNWLEDLDTTRLKTLKERYGARAGIQVVRSERTNSCGCGIFIVCQKTVLSFAAVVREGILLCAGEREELERKQEILGRFAA